MRGLALFAGGGGDMHGMQLAGFDDVEGVDFVLRQDLPPGVTVHRGDLRELFGSADFLTYVRGFDLVTAGPPCKVHTRLGHLRDAQGGAAIHGDLVAETRAFLDLAGVPYILENVEGAPVRPDVRLCGSMFDLSVMWEGRRWWLKRHRLFELGGWGMMGVGLQPECRHSTAGDRPMGVYGCRGDAIPGGGQTAPTLDLARELMGMPWASWASLTQAIPPAYYAYLVRAFVAESQAAALVG